MIIYVNNIYIPIQTILLLTFLTDHIALFTGSSLGKFYYVKKMKNGNWQRKGKKSKRKRKKKGLKN